MQSPMQLLEDIRSFTKSRIILTGAELDIFTLISQGVDTAAALAGKKGLDTRAVTRLLDATVTLGLLQKENGRYRLTPDAAVLSADHPESILPMVLHMSELWETWSRLTDIVIHGKNAHSVPVAKKDEKTRNAFIGAMHVVGRKLSVEIAAALDLSGFKKLLDIGGASGTYTIAFLEKNPGMKAVIFDLPPVVSLAEERLHDAGVDDRVELVAGDFYTDPLPEGCDVALLSAIIHQNSPEQNVDLYRKIHRALVPGGMLIIRDHIMEENRVEPPAGAIFAINMLVGTEGGDTYTFSEIEEGLCVAGFTDIRKHQGGKRMDGIVTARKPS